MLRNWLMDDVSLNIAIVAVVLKIQTPTSMIVGRNGYGWQPMWFWLPLRNVGIAVAQLRRISCLIDHRSTSNERPLISVPATETITGPLQWIIQRRSPAIIRKGSAVAAMYQATDESFAVPTTFCKLSAA